MPNIRLNQGYLHMAHTMRRHNIELQGLAETLRKYLRGDYATGMILCVEEQDERRRVREASDKAKQMVTRQAYVSAKTLMLQKGFYEGDWL